MASDLALATQPMDAPGAFIGASIDFKDAHKQVQVRPDEHGLLLFAFKNKLYHYRVCHFVGRFFGLLGSALLARQVHGLLAWQPHKAFLFVDDRLCALIRAHAPEMFAFVALFFCAIGANLLETKPNSRIALCWPAHLGHQRRIALEIVDGAVVRRS